MKHFLLRQVVVRGALQTTTTTTTIMALMSPINSHGLALTLSHCHCSSRVSRHWEAIESTVIFILLFSNTMKHRPANTTHPGRAAPRCTAPPHSLPHAVTHALPAAVTSRLSVP